MKPTQTIGLVAVMLLMAVLILPTAASADVYMKQLSHTDAYTMNGQNYEPVNDTVEMWLSGDKAKLESNEAIVIARKDQNVVYFIDPATKTYSEVKYSDLGNAKAMMAAQGVDTANAEQMKMMESMMAMMQVKATVTPTDSTKEIEAYKTKKYDVDLQMGTASAKSVYWVTGDIKVDYDLLAKLTNMMILQMPGAAAAIDELKKMEGVPVESETTVNVMGSEMKTSMKLLSYDEKTVPASAFELPEGLTEKKMSSPFGQ